MSVRVELADFEPAPFAEPGCYPGRRAEFSYLFCGDHLRALDRIDFDAELIALDQPPLATRRAVLAYGSNACPAQLAVKWRALVSSPIIPMTRSWIRDAAIGFSDHETRYGAIPAALFEARDVFTEVFIAWLLPAQLADLDQVEAGDYERRSLDLVRHPLYVADEPCPTEVDAYLSKRGLFRSNGVVPAVALIETSYRDGPLLTQDEVKVLRAGASR